MKLGEFFIELVVDAGEGVLTLGNLVKMMGELEAVSVGELAVLFEMAEKLANMTMAAVGTALSIEQVVAKTGVSQREFQKWSSIVSQAHVTAEAFSQATVGVGQALTDLRHGVGGQELLSLNRVLGIDLSKFDSKHVFELFEAIRNSSKFRAMSTEEQDELLRKTGDGLSGILLYLQKSNAEIEEYSGHTASFSKQGYKDLLGIATAMASLTQDAKGFGDEIAQWNAPKLLKVLQTAEKIIKWLRDEFREYEGAVRAADKSAPGLARKIYVAPGVSFQDLMGPMNFLRQKALDIYGSPAFEKPESIVGPTALQRDLGSANPPAPAPVVNNKIFIDGKDIPFREEVEHATHFATEKLKAWYLLGGQQGGSR
jgi:hypothetical protein